jgi:hypothetical protein
VSNQPTFFADFDGPIDPQFVAPESPVGQEIRRRLGHGKAVLARLEQGPATSDELNALCFRYGARIFELRKRGYDIRTEQIGVGIYRYTLVR